MHAPSLHEALPELHDACIYGNKEARVNQSLTRLLCDEPVWCIYSVVMFVYRKSFSLRGLARLIKHASLFPYMHASCNSGSTSCNYGACIYVSCISGRKVGTWTIEHYWVSLAASVISSAQFDTASLESECTCLQTLAPWDVEKKMPVCIFWWWPAMWFQNFSGIMHNSLGCLFTPEGVFGLWHQFQQAYSRQKVFFLCNLQAQG